MIKSTAIMLSLAIAFSGTALAANMSEMTNSEKATMKECQSMSKSAMQDNRNCTALMKKYPDAINGSTSGSGSMSGGSKGSSGSMNSGGSSKSSGGGSMNEGGTSK